MTPIESTGAAHEGSKFHAHLHDCYRCFNHPNDLCGIGARLLAEEAIGNLGVAALKPSEGRDQPECGCSRVFTCLRSPRRTRPSSA